MNGSYEGLRLVDSFCAGTSQTMTQATFRFPDCLTFSHGVHSDNANVGYYKIVVDLKQLNSATGTYSKLSNPIDVGATILYFSVGFVFNTTYRWWHTCMFNTSWTKEFEADKLWYNSTYTSSCSENMLTYNTPAPDSSAASYNSYDSSNLIFTIYRIYNTGTAHPEIENYTNQHLCGCQVIWFKNT